MCGGVIKDWITFNVLSKFGVNLLNSQMDTVKHQSEYMNEWINKYMPFIVLLKIPVSDKNMQIFPLHCLYVSPLREYISTPSYLPPLQNCPHVSIGVWSHRRTERACPLLEGHHRFHLQWAPGLTRGSQKPPHRGTAGAAWLPPQLMHHCCRSSVVLSHH